MNKWNEIKGRNRNNEKKRWNYYEDTIGYHFKEDLNIYI